MSKIGSVFNVDDSTGEIISAGAVKDKAMHADSTDGASIGLSATNRLQVRDEGVTRQKIGATAGQWKQAVLTASDVVASVYQVQNLSGGDLIVGRVLIKIDTVSTGACTIDAGVGAGAAVSYDNLLDDLDVNAAAGVFDNITDNGANGRSRQVLANNEYINVSMSTGATAGLVGFIQVELIDLDTADT